MHRSPPDPPDLTPAVTTSRSSDLLRDAVDLFLRAPTHERPALRAFGDLLCGLLPDADRAERRRIGSLLARRADVPLAVARLIALDEAEVAGPMIVHSPVLTSADLVQIMRCGPAHVRLVAERLDLAPDIAAALTRTPPREPGRAAMAPTVGADHAICPRPPEPATVSLPGTAAKRAMPAVAGATAAAGTGPTATAASETSTAKTRRAGLPGIEFPTSPREEKPMSETTSTAAVARDDRRDEPTSIDAAMAFFTLDPAGRWHAIQEATALTTLASAAPRRRRAGEAGFVAPRLFAAAVRKDREALERELGEALDLEPDLTARILDDRHGEPLAVALAALGIEERTATSILLLHIGERAGLTQMQDLTAMAGGIGWRAADHLLSLWRGERPRGLVETVRQLDPGERRGLRRDEPSERRVPQAADTARRSDAERS